MGAAIVKRTVDKMLGCRSVRRAEICKAVAKNSAFEYGPAALRGNPQASQKP